MATLTGLWVLHDKPNLYVYNSKGYIMQKYLYATSNGKDIRSMQITETDQTLAYATTEGWFNIYENNAWVDEAYKILDFGEYEAIVSDEFYTWFTANASNGPAEPVKHYLIREDSLKYIADGFRSSRGTTQKYTLDEMAVMAAEPVGGGGDEWGEQFIAAIERDSSNPVTKLPEGLTKIGDYAFYNSDLALLSLPYGVTSIGSRAFYGCNNLALTKLPDGLTKIGTYAFSSCKNLALTKLPDGITEISERTFYECTNLPLLSLPDGVTAIGDYAFQKCDNLALTELPDGLTRIGDYAFASCKNLALTKLPVGVTSIGNQAFASCIKLTEITFGRRPIALPSYTFNNCDNLLTINVPWAEGEVSGAPWGATNATINYNYTGG